MHHCIQEELSIKDVYTIHQLNGVLTSYHCINQANNGLVREITPPSFCKGLFQLGSGGSE